MRDSVREVTRIWTEAVRERRVPSEILAPGFVMTNAVSAVTERTYLGADGVEQWLDDFAGLIEEWNYDAEPVAITDEVAIGRITMKGVGRVSGAPLDLSHYGVLWVEDGKVTRAEGHNTKREAFAAAGL